jgi:hypothetical protein
MTLRFLLPALLVLVALASGCGGGSAPPEHPPPVKPVRPTVEKGPPPQPAQEPAEPKPK